MGSPGSDQEDFRRWTLLAILLSVLLRWIWIAFASPPPLPEEARFWAYGQRFAWGYLGEQPLGPWLVRVSTDIFGDSIFGLRSLAPVLHGLAAWLIFASGRHLFGEDEEGPRVGFWAALSFLVMPGIVVSSGFMTDAPGLILCWALALYALVRAMAGGEVHWWVLLGAALGLGFLASPMIVAFALCALGYALASRERDARIAPAGGMIAAGVALLVASPNLLWVAREGRLLRDAGEFSFVPWRLAEFVGGQFGVLGPILFVGLVLVTMHGKDLRADWRLRLLLWLSLPLIAAMALKAYLTGADFQDAGVAYVAGVIAACAFFVRRNFSKLLQVSTAIGVGIWLAYWSLASLYDTRHATLPRSLDPFKKLRQYQPVCKASLATLETSGSLLVDDARLLAVCMYEGRLQEDRAAIWNPGGLDRTRFERVMSLETGDARNYVFVTLKENPENVTGRFEEAELISKMPFQVHRDRTYVASVWSLSGFKGYE